MYFQNTSKTLKYLLFPLQNPKIYILLFTWILCRKKKKENKERPNKQHLNLMILLFLIQVKQILTIENYVWLANFQNFAFTWTLVHMVTTIYCSNYRIFDERYYRSKKKKKKKKRKKKTRHWRGIDWLIKNTAEFFILSPKEAQPSKNH